MAFSPFNLSGKTVLITGGNGGIGLGMANALAAAGANIVIWGTNLEKNKQAASALAPHSVKTLTQVVDVSQENAVIAAQAEAISEMGRLDAVFANAGIYLPAPSFLEMSANQFQKVLDINLKGAFFTLREAARHMVERAKKGDPGGSLIVTASVAAIDGAANNEAYAASKGGVVSMMRGLAVEFARYRIRANAILPGWISTDMTHEAQASPAFTDKVIPRVPARRWGEPDDFGGIAVYLASDASAFHTGDTLVIDGGYTIY
ncbi:MAG TPA: 2-deoxy-D-gluconate 3-dehydrogenase [Gammaproteobacteria bacterium]|nr:2-deoxy-D-gluconate 3-dehydrogenase [Gammaproteobacteria bacterium]